MASQRRVKVYGLVLFLAILVTIYFTSAAGETRSSDFYRRTSAALVEKHERAAAEAAAKLVESDKTPLEKDHEVGARLKEAEEKAKLSAERKGQKLAQQVMADRNEQSESAEESATKPDKSEQIEKSEKGVGGRYKIPEGTAKEGDGVAKVGGNVDNKQKHISADETEEEHEVEQELNAILKKSPIIVFSKTYCPHSKKAKHILVDQYKINPAPFVVELDEHPLGPALQAALGRATQRRTVPNILINGVSIGGGDEIQALHDRGKIISTVMSMAGNRITEIKPAR